MSAFVPALESYNGKYCQQAEQGKHFWKSDVYHCGADTISNLHYFGVEAYGFQWLSTSKSDTISLYHVKIDLFVSRESQGRDGEIFPRFHITGK